MAPSPMGGPLETAAPGPPGYGCGHSRIGAQNGGRKSAVGSASNPWRMRKLGIAVSERTVSRLLPRRGRPPSQTWRTFLANHATALVSMDFFTVPTLTGRVLFVFVLLAH
jgi:hypothetical protein